MRIKKIISMFLIFCIIGSMFCTDEMRVYASEDSEIEKSRQLDFANEYYQHQEPKNRDSGKIDLENPKDQQGNYKNQESIGSDLENENDQQKNLENQDGEKSDLENKKEQQENSENQESIGSDLENENDQQKNFENQDGEKSDLENKKEQQENSENQESTETDLENQDRDKLNLKTVNNQQKDNTNLYDFSKEIEDNKEINGQMQTDFERRAATSKKSKKNEGNLISYQTHIQTIGWQDWKRDGEISGTSGEKKRIEAIALKLLDNTYSGSINYQSYIQDIGWQEWQKDGNLSGTMGLAKRIESVRIMLTGEVSEYYDVYYRVHVQSFGWLNWAKNGENSGTIGTEKRIEAIQIILSLKEEEIDYNFGGIVSQNELSSINETCSIIYQTHIQKIGWQDWKKEGEVSGTSGEKKRIEAFKIELKNPPYPGTVMYQSYVEGNGWQDWKFEGELAGTSGQAKRIEAVRVKLSGEISEYYDIYYRVHVQSYGWMNWAKNGEKTGTVGYNKRIEGIQILLSLKEEQINVNIGNIVSETDSLYIDSPCSLMYQTHVQTIGWQNWKHDGEISGTSGEAKRVEAIVIKLDNPPYPGDITYQSCIEGIGWQEWKRNGEISGTSGEARRLEAIRIKLSGEISEHYNVYYRVHCQSYGWLNWAKNGAPAGTEDYAKRMEAIQIVLLKKSDKIENIIQDIVSACDYAYVAPEIGIGYQTLIQGIGWSGLKVNGEISGTTNQKKEIDALKISLQHNPYEGGILYQTYIPNYGWQDWRNDGEAAGNTSGQQRVEAIKIKLTGTVAEYYEVCYRAHIQSYGWMNWVLSDDIVGVVGEGKRIEAIEIQLIEKGKGIPPSLAAGNIVDYEITTGNRNSIDAVVKAIVETKVESSDDYYYIVEVESDGSLFNKSYAIASVRKDENMSIAIAYTSKGNVNAAIMNKVALAVYIDGEYQLISQPVGITNPEAVAENTTPILKPTSKKGLQGIGHTGALDTNSKNTLFNLDLASVVGNGPAAGYVAYEYKGRTYYFSNCSDLVAEFKELDKGIIQYAQGITGKKNKVCVTLNLLLSYKASNAYLIDPAARTPGHNYYTLNMREERARETLEAVFLYLGELFGQHDCYVTHWVLGNEVNSSKAWNYQGSLSFAAYMQSYATAFRLLYNGVKAAKTGNNVYISLDNGWTAAPDTYAGKTTLDTFASYAQKENPHMRWSIAYHGYSYPLTRVDFWNDSSNTVFSTSTKYISMKNISVLTDYAAALERTYNKPSGSIRVIFSEQGYTAGGRYDVEAKSQAQALARGYYMAEFNNRVDAFIIRALNDDSEEMKGNLYFGLKTNGSLDKYADTKRITFYTYEYMDSNIDKFANVAPSTIALSSENQKKVREAQRILSNTNWSSIIPGFSKSKLAGMY